MRVKVTDPKIRNAMHKMNVRINGTNPIMSGGIRSKVIRGGSPRTAEILLNEFYSKMTAKYANFKVINVNAVEMYTGIVYTVTYTV